MDINDFLSIINTVGFPIAMCIALLVYIYKMQESHKEETNNFAEALNKNTIVLQKICDKLGEEDIRNEG